MTEAAKLFLAACKTHGVKKANPHMIRFFTEVEPVFDEIETIDLTGNYIGNRGLLALLDVIEKLPSFRCLDISNQKIYNTDLSEDSVKGNAVVDRIVDVFKAHPTAQALVISQNPISNYAGRRLLHLAQTNHRICRIEMDNTRVDFDLRRRIHDQCEKNTTNLWETQQTEAVDEETEFGAKQWKPVAKGADLSAIGGASTRRKTVRAEGVDPEAAKRYEAPVIEKSEEDILLITQLLQHNVLFSFLGSRELRTVALAMQRRVFVKGQDLMVQGGLNDSLYVLQSGSADILKENQRVFVKNPGTAVGELELMYEAPCAATVRIATDECVTWKLDRETYRNLVMGSAIRRREEYSKHLEKIAFLDGISFYERMQIADALSSDEWQPGDALIRFDEEGEWMFIVLEGTVEVIGRNHGEKVHVCEFTAGDIVGELEFLNNHRTVADVVAKTFVRTAKLNRRHFEMCMGPVVDILKRNSHNPKFTYYQKVLAGEQVA